MPTARELLDQADALMRRNRKRGKGRFGDIPTLTDALDTVGDSALAPTLVLPDAPAVDPIVLDRPAEAANADHAAAVPVDPMPLDTLADLPVLTDVVVDWPPADPSLLGTETEATVSDALHDGVEIEWPGDAPVATPTTPATTDEGISRDAAEQGSHVPEEAQPAGTGASEALADAVAAVARSDDAFPASAAEAQAAAAGLSPPAVLEREADDESAADHSASQDAPAHAVATPRVPFLDDDFILEIPPVDEAEASLAPPLPVSPIGATPLTAGSREWDALAEEIRMQVLQRLDIFTDTGLREQLGERLAPIVERASAQLIETINRELGELVRGYVAEAIEREIASWRNQKAQ